MLEALIVHHKKICMRSIDTRHRVLDGVIGIRCRAIQVGLFEKLLGMTVILRSSDSLSFEGL